MLWSISMSEARARLIVKPSMQSSARSDSMFVMMMLCDGSKLICDYVLSVKSLESGRERK